MIFPDNVESLGRMARILIPISKIDKIIGGKTIRTKLYSYLEETFGGFTEEPIVWGVWGGIREAHVRITVSFLGKEKIPAFLDFLGELCEEMNEKCLYLEMGEESYLIHPQSEDK